MKIVLRACLLILFGLVGLIVAAGFVLPLNETVALPGGGSLRVRRASFWVSLADKDSLSNCKVVYQPASGKAGKVVFWQNGVNGPDYVFPSIDGHSILCLYNWDTSEPLLKIDTSRDFKGSDNWIVKAVVLSSPWHIDRASLADWQEAEAYLIKVNRTSHLGDVRTAIGHLQHGEPSIQYGGERSNSVDP